VKGTDPSKVITLLDHQALYNKFFAKIPQDGTVNVLPSAKEHKECMEKVMNYDLDNLLFGIRRRRLY